MREGTSQPGFSCSNTIPKDMDTFTNCLAEGEIRIINDLSSIKKALVGMSFHRQVQRKCWILGWQGADYTLLPT